VALVGFDADPALVEQLRNGFIDAIVTQQPFQMGYQGVYQLVNALTGQPVTDRVDTGTIVVTADNVDDPATQGGQYALECG
jgi:ribose transport system substrate-binding protein